MRAPRGILSKTPIGAWHMTPYLKILSLCFSFSFFLFSFSFSPSFFPAISYLSNFHAPTQISSLPLSLPVYNMAPLDLFLSFSLSFSFFPFFLLRPPRPLQNTQLWPLSGDTRRLGKLLSLVNADAWLVAPLCPAHTGVWLQGSPLSSLILSSSVHHL